MFQNEGPKTDEQKTRKVPFPTVITGIIYARYFWLGRGNQSFAGREWNADLGTSSAAVEVGDRMIPAGLC